MDGDVLSSSSVSSAAAAAASEKKRVNSDSSLPQGQQGYKSSEDLWMDSMHPVGGRLLSVDKQVTLITESMTVTSNDQEKMLLLNKNTELRRVNKELKKLNDEWDQMYHSTALGFQNKLQSLEQENSAVKQLNTQLQLKVERQQSAKEYYEQELMLQLKKNQELHRYIRLLESRMHPEAAHLANSNTPKDPHQPQSHVSGCNSTTSFFPASPSPEACLQGKGQSSSTPLGALGDSQQEVQDLKEQLEAMRCQTEIYEAEYQTAHKDHKHTQQENQRLRRKREGMRQQVALLQEQLKVYEDDFPRERSDKQMLQRLLLKKSPPKKDPVLIHRCNNDQQPLGGDKWT